MSAIGKFIPKSGAECRLYWYRERFRLSYGIFEFIVGVIMTYYIFFPNFDYSKLGPVEAIQILGGLYVMVRGLNN
ncbi:hypothetical protein KAM447_24400 [Aeromonas caviae]|uniref:hypothetical protein n=1 Tax=Aeromonas caviae TaxID=648 RepID=UPI001FC859C0|nr:hypothetical protein [Aeromonas caviae]GKQ75932.1 hypothetical protein KAM447_24400 [Aeromonas caviae]